MFRHMFRQERRGCGERHMRGGPGRHFGRRHGGGGRMLEQGELRLLLLKLIADTPRHGYELIKAIEEATGGGYSPSPGVIYPTLTLLEEMGLATMTAEGGKKQYAATPEGLAELAQNEAQVTAIFGRFQGGGEGASAAPLLRAMHNLKLALRLRLHGGPLSEERIREIAAAIDAAAHEAER
jgi:DNA-binding PadR family transcriptional regulator